MGYLPYAIGGVLVIQFVLLLLVVIDVLRSSDPAGALAVLLAAYGGVDVLQAVVTSDATTSSQRCGIRPEVEPVDP